MPFRLYTPTKRQIYSLFFDALKNRRLPWDGLRVSEPTVAYDPGRKRFYRGLNSFLLLLDAVEKGRPAIYKKKYPGKKKRGEFLPVAWAGYYDFSRRKKITRQEYDQEISKGNKDNVAKLLQTGFVVLSDRGIPRYKKRLSERLNGDIGEQMRFLVGEEHLDVSAAKTAYRGLVGEVYTAAYAYAYKQLYKGSVAALSAEIALFYFAAYTGSPVPKSLKKDYDDWFNMIKKDPEDLYSAVKLAARFSQMLFLKE